MLQWPLLREPECKVELWVGDEIMKLGQVTWKQLVL